MIEVSAKGLPQHFVGNRDAKTNFGIEDKDRKDSFDVKQAAFLKYFEDSDIDIPDQFPSEKSDEHCLQAKQNVLMQNVS